MVLEAKLPLSPAAPAAPYGRRSRIVLCTLAYSKPHIKSTHCMKKRNSKADWLEMALDVLGAEGVKAIRVEHLARRLGTSKSGFYWHFEDRDDLLRQLLDYWSSEYTDVVRDNPEVRNLQPIDRLRKTMEMVLEHDLNEYDLSIRSWGSHDPVVARRYFRVIRRRMDFIREAFADLGFEGEELELRARVFQGFVTWERFAYPGTTKKARRERIPQLLDFLTRR